VPTPTRSLNFAFLAVHDDRLAVLGTQAERLFAEDPNAALTKLRLFAELLAQRAAANAGLYASYQESQADLLGRLVGRSVITRDIADLFHSLRKAGNAASHDLRGDAREALHQLRMARELGVWFHRAFGNTKGWSPGPFIPPPDPQAENQALTAELERLRKELTSRQAEAQAAKDALEQEARLRLSAEERATKEAEERAIWAELAEMTEAAKTKLAAELEAVQTKAAAAPAAVRDAVSAQAAAASAKVVLDEQANRVVCERLAAHIDPSSEEKTLIFCATDGHADIVVRVLKEAFDRQYGSVDDDAVIKITGRADKPRQLIRRLRNERLPSVAVTVDLLTTGIDIPKVSNLVFLRRVKSRILYEQMLGRATRLCPDIKKEAFRIFDAVDLYTDIQAFSDMKPVVVNPTFTFEQLVNDLGAAPETSKQAVLDQLLAKLQSRRRRLKADEASAFVDLAGMTPADLIHHFRCPGAGDAAAWFKARPGLVSLLDRRGPSEASLLAKAFRGELVPQDPNDKPAEVMLASLREGGDAASSAPRGKRVGGRRG
jgi:hypothetical protein